MVKFSVDGRRCVHCGECVRECPRGIIAFSGEYPAIASDQEASCLKCQHCLAVCPGGAISLLGFHPDQSHALAGNYPEPFQLETLIKGRRSVRRYMEENLEPKLLQRILDVAWHAPTGVNARQVRFTVIDDRKKLARFRSEVMSGLGRLVRDGALPEGLAFFAGFVSLWEEKGIDVIFRGAPHLLVASAPKNCPSPQPDCLIALSYFDLFAQSLGAGTVWAGLAKAAIDDLLPETRASLGIPDDHVIGYAMLFGKPAVRYARTVQRGAATIHRI